MAPEDTTRTSRRPLCRPAISAASEASHSRLRPPAEESTSNEEPTFTTMRRKSLSDGVFCIAPKDLFMAALCSTGLAASSWPGTGMDRGGSCAEPGMVSFRRGRSDAVCSLWRRAGDCAWQRTVRARLAVGPDVPHGGHQSRAECRPSARSSQGGGERGNNSVRSRGAGKRGKTDAGRTRATKSESRGANRCARLEPEPKRRVAKCDPEPESEFEPKREPGSGFVCSGAG